MASVRITGEDSVFLRDIFEGKGINTARRYAQYDYIINVKYGSFTSIKSSSNRIDIAMNPNNEILASGLALETIITGSGIDFQYFPEEKQKKRILIVGCGGVGSNCCLALSNLDTPFTVIDFDRIEEHNAQSQFLFKKHPGKKKGEVISEYTKCKFIDGKIEEHTSLLQSHDLILSCVDNWEARMFLSKATRKLKKKFLNVSVSAVHASIEYMKSCLQCLYKPEMGKQSCHETQNLFAMNYIAGALAAEIASSNPKSVIVANNGKRILSYSPEKEVACVC